LRVREHSQVRPPKELRDVGRVRVGARAVEDGRLFPADANRITGIHILPIWELVRKLLRGTNHQIIEGYVPVRKGYPEETRLEMS
jgi:hypothetical protein